jgi:dTDP-glucose pyrophosphorylase
MKQNIVITMAGKGSRFYDAGYKVPKYQIMAHGKSLFEWSMLSLKNFITDDSRLIFVCLAENKSEPFVRNTCDQLGLKNVAIFELDKLTDGQATSAYASHHLWNNDLPLLIYNIDTFVLPRALKPENIRSGSDGWIPCFRVLGSHWSFVRLDDDLWAAQVAEKNRISDNASIGLYWFSTAQQYLEAYEEFFNTDENLVKGEKYIAPMYAHLINQGLKISISNVAINDVHVLGTPKELDAFLALDLTSWDHDSDNKV